MENRIKKDMYNSSPVDLRTKVKIGEDEEIAMKPYYYYRNGKLHIRYGVDRCIELSSTESARLKVELTSSGRDKQEVLAEAWNLFTTRVGKTVIRDGIAEIEKMMKGAENGQQN